MGEPSGLTEPENAALVLPVTVGTEGLTAGAAGTPAVIWPTTDKERSRAEAADAYGGPVELAVTNERYEI